MISRHAFTVALAAIAASTCSAQTERTRTRVVVPSEPAKVTLSMRGAEATPLLAVTGKDADVRATLNDMATKAGLKLVLDNSATGTFSGTVDAQPAEAAIAAVAKLAGFSVRKIVVPGTNTAGITADFAGRYADTLSGLSAGTLISDPATGKSLIVSATTPAGISGQSVLFVYGRLAQPGAFGARQRMPRTGAQGGPGQSAQPSQANQAFVDSATKSLQAMPLQQRMDTLRSLQMQLMQGLTDAERTQLRSMGGGFGGFGGRTFGRRNGNPGGPGAMGTQGGPAVAPDAGN